MPLSASLKRSVFAFLALSFAVSNLAGPSVSASGSTNLRIQILPLCGNDIKESGERCDGSDLGGESCVSQGYTSGVLSCDQACGVFDYSACVYEGGHGTGFSTSPTTSVAISGHAYPGGTVTILKDGQKAATVVADADAGFAAVVSGLNGGSYLFGVYAQDIDGSRSPILNIPVSVSFGGLTQVSGVLTAPTISGDKDKAASGDVVTLTGRSAPKSEITLTISSVHERSFKTSADAAGTYSYALDAAALGAGKYEASAKSARDGAVSPASEAYRFAIAADAEAVAALPEEIAPKTDFNDDGRVDLVDFSIVLYWYERPLSDEFKAFEAQYLNGDGKLDLVDFSILAFNWTG